MAVTRDKIIAWCKREFKCDSVRFSRPGRKTFLVLGWRKGTEEDIGQWYRNGEPYDFDYLEEHCIASGNTLAEVWRSARECNALSGMDNEDAWRLLLGCRYEGVRANAVPTLG